MNLRLRRMKLKMAPLSVPLVIFAAANCTAAYSDPAVDTQPVVVSTVVSSPAPHLRYRIVVNHGQWDQIRTDKWDLPTEVAAAIQEKFAEKLENSGWFIVVERDEASEPPAAGMDSSGADAGAPHPLVAAADFIVTPTVAGYLETKVSKTGVNIGDVRIGGDLGEATATINVRIADATTDDLLGSVTAIGRAHIKSNTDETALVGVDFIEQEFDTTPAGEAVDAALDDAVIKLGERLSAEPWSALVATQDETSGRVVINAGELAGVVVGETFDVYRAGQPVVDPVTGQTISNGDETIVGRIRVVRVERYASYCDVVNGDKFYAKDIVKPTP